MSSASVIQLLIRHPHHGAVAPARAESPRRPGRAPRRPGRASASSVASTAQTSVDHTWLTTSHPVDPAEAVGHGQAPLSWSRATSSPTPRRPSERQRGPGREASRPPGTTPGCGRRASMRCAVRGDHVVRVHGHGGRHGPRVCHHGKTAVVGDVERLVRVRRPGVGPPDTLTRWRSRCDAPAHSPMAPSTCTQPPRSRGPSAPGPRSRRRRRC
jgi:hypothetical protein